MNDVLPVNYHGMSTPELCAMLNVTTHMLIQEQHPDFRDKARKRLIAIRQVLAMRMRSDRYEF